MVATKALGKQGLTVSAQGLGCMSLSLGSFHARPNGFTDEEAVAVLRRAFELGIRFCSNADFYGNAEEILGKAIQGVPRDQVVILNKWGLKMDAQPGLDLRKICEQSLQLLGVDCIDLWMLRCTQGQAGGASIKEAMIGMKEMVDAGKVKYLGLSEASIENLRTAHKIHPISAVELEWSLFTRDCEEDYVPVCRELGIGIVAYSPLGSGFLTGKIPEPDDLPAGDYRKEQPRFCKDHYNKNVELAQRVTALAERKGCTPGQLALAWVHHQGPDVVPIPGTRSIKHLEENVGALDVKLTPAEMQELEAAVPHTQVRGDRFPKGAGLTYRG